VLAGLYWANRPDVICLDWGVLGWTGGAWGGFCDRLGKLDVTRKGDLILNILELVGKTCKPGFSARLQVRGFSSLSCVAGRAGFGECVAVDTVFLLRFKLVQLVKLVTQGVQELFVS